MANKDEAAVAAAHAAGAKDGSQGLGPIPPKAGKPGSRQRRLYDAYMQSYRDALVARTGVPPHDRRRNPSTTDQPGRESVESRDGVYVGQYTDLPKGGFGIVRSIHKFSHDDPWRVGVQDLKHGHSESLLLKDLTRRGKKRRVSGCYAVGPGPIRRRKVNPTNGINVAERKKTLQLYRSFREDEPVGKLVRAKFPSTLARMGVCEFIGYMTTHKGRTALYVHHFAPGSRPALYAGAGRGKLYLMGGRFTVTDRGITDLNPGGRPIDYTPRYEVRLNPYRRR